MAKLTNVSRPKSKQYLTNTQDVPRNKVHISFKYLYKSTSGSLKELHKKAKKVKDDSYFEILQKFIYEAENVDNIEDMIGLYTSENGSKISDANPYVKRIITSFKRDFPNEDGLVKDNLIHLHAQRNGKGKFVLFGVTYENTFYILALDPNHDFNR